MRRVLHAEQRNRVGAHKGGAHKSPTDSVALGATTCTAKDRDDKSNGTGFDQGSLCLLAFDGITTDMIF